MNYVLDEDHPALAWQAAVVAELARRVPRVTVLTEQWGRSDLPANVEVELLPHRPLGIPRRLGGGFLAARGVAARLRSDRPDACFVHMAADWLLRLGWVLRALGIPVVLWYAHGTVTLRLRLATAFAQRVLTSTPDGFRLSTPKKRVIGQGIDVRRFVREDRAADGDVVLSVNRISPRKRLDLVVDAFAQAARREPGRMLRLRLVGSTLTRADSAYEVALRERVRREGLSEVVEVVGSVPHDRLIGQYRDVFLHLNLSDTGSMDKSVVEALASGTPVLTSNPAFRQLLAHEPAMLLEDVDPGHVASRILALHDARHTFDAAALRALVVGRHDLQSYADRVLQHLLEVADRPRGRTRQRAE